MRSHVRGIPLEAGVDWITVTACQSDSIEKCRTIALSLIDVELSQGMFGKPWFQSGYEGVACGHVQYGERPDGCIVRLGSVVAATHWRRLFEASDNCSRLDLQVTCRIEGNTTTVLDNHYAEFQRRRRELKRGPKLAKCVNDDGGYTIYTGRKCSDRFGRIYDKFAESGMERFKNCLRYEVQYNGKRARSVALAVIRDSVNLAGLAASCLEFFSHRGANLCRLTAQLTDFVFLKTSTARVIKADTERVLRWLGHAVRPSVKRLLNFGLQESVINALGVLKLPYSLNYQYNPR